MSYTLHIWNPVLNNSLAEASFHEIGDRLVELAQITATDADRALFSELGRRMWGLYPSDEEQDTAEEIFQDNLESEGRTVLNRLWTIQLFGGERVRVLRDIAAQANAIGLAVFDDQIGIGFDPRLGVIPSVRTQDWQIVLEVLRDQSASRFDNAYIRKNIMKPINEKLSKMGFIENHQADGLIDCMLDQGQVRQDVCYTLIGGDPSPKLRISLRLNVPEIQRINALVMEDAADCFLEVSLSEYTCGQWAEIFESEQQVQEFLIAFDSHFIPLIEKCKAIEGLEQMFFSPNAQQPLPASHNFFKKRMGGPNIDLSFARCNLAGITHNPRLEEIVMKEWQSYTFVDFEYHQKWRKELMDLLRYFKDPAAYEREHASKKIQK